METCCCAHHLGHELLGQGQNVRLMPSKYVKREEVACEAVLAPPSLAAGGNSTQLVNQARDLLLERGIATPQGKPCFGAQLPEILADPDNGLRDRMRELVADVLDEGEQP